MTSNGDGFYVMAFSSANHSIQTEKKAKELFEITVIPTPEELMNDCGLTIKFHCGDIDAIKAFYNTLTIPADVYFISNIKTDGKRKTEKIL